MEELNEDAKEIAAVVHHLHACLFRDTEIPVLSFAAKTLGKLAFIRSSTMTELLTVEMAHALEQLDSRPRPETKRFAAVLLLTELAKSAPGIFYNQVGTFIRVCFQPF